MLQIPQAALLAGTFRKENGGDFAGALPTFGGKRWTADLGAKRPSEGRLTVEPARGPGGNTNATRGSDGSGWDGRTW